MLSGVEVKSEQMSLLQKMESDSAVLTLVGSLFRHWGAETEKKGMGAPAGQLM